MKEIAAMIKKQESKPRGKATRPEAPGSLLPLRPSVFAMLLVLNGGDMHGYGIMKRVNESGGTGGLLGPGTLYRTLKEMRHLGLVTYTKAPEQTDNDERRSYYTLTSFGREVVVAEATRIARLMKDGQLAEILGDPK